MELIAPSLLYIAMTSHFSSGIGLREYQYTAWSVNIICETRLKNKFSTPPRRHSSCRLSTLRAGGREREKKKIAKRKWIFLNRHQCCCHDAKTRHNDAPHNNNNNNNVRISLTLRHVRRSGYYGVVVCSVLTRVLMIICKLHAVSGVGIITGARSRPSPRVHTSAFQ